MSAAGLIVREVGVACLYGMRSQALFAGCATRLSVLRQEGNVCLEDEEGNLLPAWQGAVPDCEGSPEERITSLVRRALESLVHGGDRSIAYSKAVAYITLPGDSTARGRFVDPGALAEVVREITEVTEVEFDRGPGAPERVLKAASEALQEGRAESCLVGGVDTLLNEQSAEELRAMGRLRLYSDEDGYGLGEGAAFVRIATGDSAPDAAVLSWNGAPEPSEGRAAEEILQGAVNAAGPMAQEGVDVIVHDLDVTAGGAMEWNQVTAALWPARLDEVTRLAVQVGELYEAGQVEDRVPETLGVCRLLGHAGTASIWLRLAAAWERLRFAHAPVERVLVLDDSEPGWRSAFLLKRVAA